MNGHVTANGHANGTTTHNYDIVIIGAGISGINSAYRVQTALPSSTYTILDARHEIGGTVCFPLSSRP